MGRCELTSTTNPTASRLGRAGGGARSGFAPLKLANPPTATGRLHSKADGTHAQTRALFLMRDCAPAFIPKLRRGESGTQMARTESSVACQLISPPRFYSRARAASNTPERCSLSARALFPSARIRMRHVGRTATHYGREKRAGRVNKGLRKDKYARRLKQNRACAHDSTRWERASESKDEAGGATGIGNSSRRLSALGVG